MTATAPGGVTFDPFEPGFVDSPYEQYGRLRAADPVHWSPLLHGWVLTRYEDVARVLRDATVSSDLASAAPSPLVDAERARQAAGGRRSDTLVLRDDPDHARLRRLLQQPFNAPAIARLRGMVQELVDDAVTSLRGRGEIDVIGDFAYPLPVTVFCRMLGMPEEDSPRFREWTQAVARTLDPVLDDSERERCLALLDEMQAYLEEQIEAKRRHPAEDVLTVLVHAEEDGDRLTPDELVAQLVTLYVAGHEPTMALVGNGLLALLRQPEQLARLQSEPGALPNAVNELLRYDGPNQFVRRIATEPLSLADRTIEPGHVIYVGVGAANRDPARWGADADLVRIDRPDAVHHLQFGSGIHSCLGAHLARLQSEVALGALVHRFERVRLAGEPVWNERMVLRGLQALPVAIG